MTDPLFTIVLATASLAAVAIMTTAALVGWKGWLQLKAQELTFVARGAPDRETAGIPAAGARIEIADLKERIRKLEAIAAGVDL